MPNNEFFAKVGLKLTQRVVYEYVEIGISANGTRDKVVVYLDDVSVEVH